MTTPSEFLKKQTDLMEELLKVTKHNDEINVAAIEADALGEDAGVEQFKQSYLRAYQLERNHVLIKQKLLTPEQFQERVDALEREHKQVDAPAVTLPHTPTGVVTESQVAAKVTQKTNTDLYEETVTMQASLKDAVSTYKAAVETFNQNESELADHLSNCESILKSLNVDPKTVRHPSLAGHHTQFGAKAVGDAKKGAVNLNDAAPKRKGPGCLCG